MTPEEAKSWLETPDDYELDLDTVCDALVTVAGLKYEYAVQVVEGGRTWYINSYKTLTSGSRSAVWLPTFGSADALRRKCVTELCMQERCAETFVVRRLASELEVIDPGVDEYGETHTPEEVES